MSDRNCAEKAQRRHRDGDRPGHGSEKKLIEDAYLLGGSLGLWVWCTDQAGPFQTVPYAGACWQSEGKPLCQPHEYLRNGTAKILTLLHPADGQVRVSGVSSCPNTILHGWLQQELGQIVGALPTVSPDTPTDAEAVQASWQRWQMGLTVKPTLPQTLPPLGMLLILDNLAGHWTPAFVLWLFAHGIMPLYTPLGGSWLNMAESIQRILKRRALNGQHPTDTDPIISWFEAVTAHWNRDPTSFEWGGKRQQRRRRQWERRHPTGGSGALTQKPIARRSKSLYFGGQCK